MEDDNMDERNVPYVKICRHKGEMHEMFRHFLKQHKSEIARSSNVDYRIDLNDGKVILFVTEQRFYAKDNSWRMGRIYKILGEGEQVYRGICPIRK